jgi:hypothetical protein
MFVSTYTRYSPNSNILIKRIANSIACTVFPRLCFFVALERNDFILDEKLRQEMIDAYANGEYKKALKLSRQLDKQVLTHYSDKRKSKKPRKKEKDIEI